MAINGVIFDLEGTIFSVEDCHFRGFVSASASYGITTTVEALVAVPGLIGAGDKRAIEMILEKAGRSDVDPEEFRQRKMKEYNALLELKTPTLRPGFLGVYRQIALLRIPMAVASLTPKSQARSLIMKTELDKYIPFENMLFREDVKNAKPHPEVFTKAASLMGVPPEKTLVFGDSVNDMKAAVAAEAYPVAVPFFWIDSLVADLKHAGAKHIFRDWRTIEFDGLLNSINNPDPLAKL